MAERWFLKVDGIVGESMDARHAGEIDILSWSWGVSQSATTGVGTGAGAGKASFRDFQFVTNISAASPKLLQACATGQHLKSAVLSGERAGAPTSSSFLSYTLTDVIVTRVEHGDAETTAPVEQFALAYRKVAVAFRSQKPTGAFGPPVTFSFDLATSKTA